MAAVVIDMSRTDDQRDVVHRAVQALAEGKLVAFPTETVYGVAASALDGRAVERLRQLKGRAADQPFTLAVKSCDDALDYVPDMLPLARRLARRCWPGPITLVLDDDSPDSLVRQLPESVRKAVTPRRSIGLRVPAHPLILSVLRLSSGPLALTSANRGGQKDAVTAQEVLETLGDDVDLVLDDGKSQFGQPSAVIQVTQQGLKILRQGILNETNLKRLASYIVLVVCTGNTCRSPMAEGLLRKMIATRLGCLPDKLDDHGVMVLSAGIAAMSGGRSAPEAVQVLAEQGIDLSRHESQPLSDRLVRFADLILTMTNGHRQALLAQWPDAASRTKVLRRDGNDVSDPIGSPIEVYRSCALQIQAELEQWLPDLCLHTGLLVQSEGE